MLLNNKYLNILRNHQKLQEIQVSRNEWVSHGYQLFSRAGGTDSNRGRGFLFMIWSPVRLAEVLKLFENYKKNVILLVVEILQISIHNT